MLTSYRCHFGQLKALAIESSPFRDDHRDVGCCLQGFGPTITLPCRWWNPDDLWLSGGVQLDIIASVTNLSSWVWSRDVYLSLDDAIYVYARACRAWYGRKAASNALRAAAECRQRQDFEGERVWMRVSQEVEKVGDPVFASAFR